MNDVAHGLYVVPDPSRRDLRVDPREVSTAYRLGGLRMLREAVREILALRVRGRATNPAEYAALVAWLDEMTAEETARLSAILSCPTSSPQETPDDNDR